MSAIVCGMPSPRLAATVIVPVCNEEQRLRSSLESLLRQSVAHEVYEVIILLNNCSDGSPRIAKQFQEAHPELAFHIAEIHLPAAQANVGTARRLLMDEAARRLPADGIILSTDGDTDVACDWVENNLGEIRNGADAVGGEIALRPDDYERLSPSARLHYDADAAYQKAVTHLESVLDPDPADPWPRHHHHFGASLACRSRVYRALGGLPAVDCLEDVAFVNRMVRAGAGLRHSPKVRVSTAARTSGRARIGLASQLREWQALQREPEVDSARFLDLYFTYRSKLRELWDRGSLAYRPHLLQTDFPLLALTRDRAERLVREASSFGELHDALDLRGYLWRRMPRSVRVAKRKVATKLVSDLVTTVLALERPGGNGLRGNLARFATRDGSGCSHGPDLLWQDSPQLPA